MWLPPPPTRAHNTWVPILASMVALVVVAASVYAATGWWLGSRGELMPASAMQRRDFAVIAAQSQLGDAEQFEEVLDTSALLTRGELAIVSNRRLIYRRGDLIESVDVLDIESVERNEGNALGHQIVVQTTDADNLSIVLGPMRDSGSAALVDSLRRAATRARTQLQAALALAEHEAELEAQRLAAAAELEAALAQPSKRARRRGRGSSLHGQ